MIAITGMHRSGTSLAAQMLSLCGLKLGPENELLMASADNLDGFYENVRVIALNDDLLDALGGSWDLPPPPAGAAFDQGRLTALEERARALVLEFSVHQPWGWKDPRTSLTLDFWKRVVPGLRVVMCVRNPLEVALSLRQRGATSYRQGLMLWHAYNAAAIEQTTPAERVVVHYDALLSDAGRQVVRLARFAGLNASPGPIAEATMTAKGDLRHQRFTTANLLEVDVDSALLELYLALCREAEYDDSARPAAPIARSALAPSASSAIVDTAELDRDALTRQVASLRSALANREAAFAQLKERASKSEAELEALRRTVDDLAERLTDVLGEYVARDSLEIAGRIRAAAREVVPSGSTVLVVSEGDERLIRLRGAEGWHFPRLADGRYPGFHPDGDTSAIAQLEAARCRGAHCLLLPKSAEWWLDRYPLFARHLERRYGCLTALDACSIYDLRSPLSEEQAPWWAQVRRLVEECERGLGSAASIVDWGTGLDIESFLSDHAVVSPLDDSSLPHADGTVDVVVVRGDNRVDEARRVARALVIRLTGEAPNVAVQPDWARDEASFVARTVSIVADGRDSVRAAVETIPVGLDCEILAMGEAGPSAGDVTVVSARPGASAGEAWNQAASAAQGEVLVFVRRETVVLPDWLPPLTRIVGREDAGVAGVKVVSEEGWLVEAGVAVQSDGTIERHGAGDYRVDAPPYGYVRRVDGCSHGLLATPRSVFGDLGGFDGGYRAADYEFVDYCCRVREADRQVCYQPDSAAVALDLCPPPTADAQRLAARRSTLKAALP